MPDWDADSPELRRNLTTVLRSVARSAERREPIDLRAVKAWQAAIMKGLQVPRREWVGHVRGEPGLKRIGVRIGSMFGTPPGDVAQELGQFFAALERRLDGIDARFGLSDPLDVRGLSDVIELTAWAHGEWVRIHPFANGNGRTARILANAILMRYGLPPFVALRPRPKGGYEAAAAGAMGGQLKVMVPVLHAMLDYALRDTPTT